METVVGVFAHVDAGKTTLSEQLLYRGGTLRRAGRVDSGDTCLDHDVIERSRGITVFADEAAFTACGLPFRLIDTPGHADFSGEMERSIWAVDCAVLVVSCVEGVQAHTETVWRLLRQNDVPVVFFLNKADLPTADAAGTLAAVRARLGRMCWRAGRISARRTLERPWRRSWPRGTKR
ncbi:MAG: GTP-binding protein [Ruthenibacterium lactatiformans]